MSETGEAKDARAPAHFYVYYRVAADTAATRAAIRRLMAEVEARTGISGRLLARCDDPSTWLEIYEPVRNVRAFARTLSTCVRKSAATQVAAEGIRTSECFAALGPRAVRRPPRA